MACPLSAILNDTEISPRESERPASGSINDNAPQKDQMDPSKADSGASQFARYGELPPIISFSPQRGSLYHRRASASPNRLEGLPTPPKSDRPIHWSEDAPPSHELDFNGFSVFKALLNHPELVIEVSKHMQVEDLISLYAISKDFHFLVNSRFTTVILAQSLGKAAESSRTFLFKCYKNLCIRDPGARPNLELEGQVRFVPSFRWLRFILFRERVVDGIIACLAAEGHRLPKGASLALKKIWFTMDISDNARRIGLLHNRKFWTNTDLLLATMFFIKLDMRLTDPIDGSAETGIRKMLLAQRSLSTMWKILRREEMLNQLDMMQMFVRWKYEPAPHRRGMSVAGVHPQEIGRGQFEGWGYGSQKVLRPDELIMREAVKRKIDLHSRYLDMMIWGYIDKKTGEDIYVQDKLDGEDEDEDSTETSSLGDSEGEINFSSFELE
ncbi:hypothetical protein MMC20_001056 [Loxospora ochrophaea]|nr:hypothetical protein [Loxospora ochrophaea]